MNIKDFKCEIEGCLNPDIIKYDELLKNHTSFKLGGPAKVLITPTHKDEVIKAVDLCIKHKVPFFIVGNGSNLIVRDGGFNGVIIQLTSLKNVSVSGNKIIVEAGATLGRAALEALNSSLEGMEFASGIPGTVGGAAAMNAGAYGGEIKDIIESVLVLDIEGNTKLLTKEELELSYRSSIIQRKNYIVLEATFALKDGDKVAIKAKMDDLNGRRRDKQPLSYPSAGSTFKRPPGYFAGKLIEDAGLKGYKVGGAMISEKHAGFVINYNNATADDVLTLISNVQDKIKKMYGVTLETEVKVIGEEK